MADPKSPIRITPAFFFLGMMVEKGYFRSRIIYNEPAELDI